MGQWTRKSDGTATRHSMCVCVFGLSGLESGSGSAYVRRLADYQYALFWDRGLPAQAPSLGPDMPCSRSWCCILFAFGP